MKTPFLKSFLVLSISLTTLVGCSEEEDATAFDNLTANEWILVSAERRTSTGNSPEPVNPCRLDNVFRYEADGTFKILVGTNLCQAGETGLIGTWQLTSNDTKIAINFPGVGSYEDNIESIAAGELKLKFDVSGYSVIERYIPVP